MTVRAQEVIYDYNRRIEPRPGEAGLAIPLVRRALRERDNA
jgi:hypothetical protein